MESNNTRNSLVFSSFFLKLVALITMTIDHIGYQLQSYMYYNTKIMEAANIMRYVGRIAMPLFAFMIAEGVIHTKSKGKYALRLGIFAAIVSLFLGVLYILTATHQFDFKSIYNEGNIFMDLLLGLLVCIALCNKNHFVKLTAILPLGLSVLSFYAKSLEKGLGLTIYWYPAFLRGQYDWLCVLLVMMFYLVEPITNAVFKFHAQQVGVDSLDLKGTTQYQIIKNVLSVLMLIAVDALYYGLSILIPNRYMTWMVNIQSWMFLSGIFILLYNGKRGYNKKWFQLGAYIYYPFHMLLLAAIFYLIFGY